MCGSSDTESLGCNVKQSQTLSENHVVLGLPLDLGEVNLRTVKTFVACGMCGRGDTSIAAHEDASGVRSSRHPINMLRWGDR